MLFVTGQIAIWSGAIVDIPAGWLLCDGTLGTPDLRDRFVQGAGDSFVPDATGGANSHVHTFTSNGHSHTLSFVGPKVIDAPGAFGAGDTTTNPDTGTVDSDANIPPFHALAFIMKD